MKPEQIAQCAEESVEFHGRFAPLFYERRQCHWSAKFLHGFLLDGVRKNAAKIARAVPGAKAKALQHFISQSSWDHRPILRASNKMSNATGKGLDFGVAFRLIKVLSRTEGRAPSWLSLFCRRSCGA